MFGTYLKGKKILVQFNNQGQEIKKEDRVLASSLGTVARNPNLAPHHIPDWRKYPRTEKEKLFVTALYLNMLKLFFFFWQTSFQSSNMVKSGC